MEKPKYIIPPDMRRKYQVAGMTIKELLIVVGTAFLLVFTARKQLSMDTLIRLVIPAFMAVMLARLPDSRMNGFGMFMKILRYYMGQRSYSLGRLTLTEGAESIEAE